MTIVVTLSPELEEILRERATRQGQDVNSVASELLARILEWNKIYKKLLKVFRKG